MYDEKRLRGIESACRRIGLEEGRAQGLAEGREQGLSEGRAEGRAEAQMEMGRKLKNLGVAIETITEATGLDKETLEAL
jgi:predicted transposase/invertase (TIGR01784 family)